MADDNDRVLVNVSMDRTLLLIAQNNEHAPKSFEFRVSDCPTEEALFFVCLCLRGNTTIEWFSLKITEPTLPISPAQWQDICHFIANNPSLKCVKHSYPIHPDLRIPPSFFDSQLSNPNIRERSLREGSIETMSLHGSIEAMPLRAWQNLKDLDILVSGNIVEAWPTFHCIERLSVRASRQEGQTVSSLFDKLVHHECSSSIKSLLIDEVWCHGISRFLASPLCRVTKFELTRMEFGEAEDEEYKSLSEVILALKRNNTIKSLSIDDCALYGYSTIRGFVDAFHSSELPVRYLTLHAIVSIEDADRDIHELFERAASNCILELFNCRSLKGFNFDFVYSSRLAFVREGLRNCQLQRLCLENVDFDTNNRNGDLPLPFCDLKIALSAGSLTELCLNCPNFSQEGLAKLVNLINDEDCHLHSLALQHIWHGRNENASLEVELFRALERKNSLRKLQLWYFDSENNGDLILNALRSSLGRIHSLHHLIIRFPNNISTTVEQSLSMALLKNWSLKSFYFLHDCRDDEATAYLGTEDDSIGSCVPNMSLALCRHVDSVMERNKARYFLDSPAIPQVTKSEWCNHLARYWELPDGMTLAFCVLEQVPHLFF